MRLQPHRFVPRRVDPLVMKSLNAIEVLELVRTHGPISRARLAAFSRLSKPTVSDQVDALIARELVVEVGTGSASSRGGKKPTLVEFNCGLRPDLLCRHRPRVDSIRIVRPERQVHDRGIQLPTKPEKGRAACCPNGEAGPDGNACVVAPGGRSRDQRRGAGHCGCSQGHSA